MQKVRWLDQDCNKCGRQLNSWDARLSKTLAYKYPCCESCIAGEYDMSVERLWNRMEDVGLSLLLGSCNQNKHDDGDRDKGKNVKPGKYGDGGQCIISCVQEYAEQILRTDIGRKRNHQQHHLIFFLQCRNFEQRFADEEIEQCIDYLVHCQEHHPKRSG